MQKVFAIFLIICFYNDAYTQSILSRDTSIKIKENGIEFTSPSSGGLNSGVFSEIDLNMDGIMDLVVFDKSGNKISPFINNNNTYMYAPKYRDLFPKINDWMLLVDYNCDGKNDIFTYSSGGIVVYENTSISNLSFNLNTSLYNPSYNTNNLILSNYGGINPTNIFVSPVDIPAISDIDYDGDLDILTFSILGGFIEYHKNMSMELTGTCDTLAYELSTQCWGLFYEGLNNYVLNCPNCQCPPITTQNNTKEKHAGSTLLAIDVDNDNDKDLLLGDISYSNINLLINGGDNQTAFMINVDSIFPKNHNNTIAADIDFFPACYFIDVTHDQIKDLIITTNSTNNNAQNFESCWLYENLNQNTQPDFQFVENNFLQKDMIDLGTGFYPAFYDYNNDNLIDIIVGNYGYYNANNDPISSLALFENIGTNEKPEYNLIDRDWLNISGIPLNTTLNIPALNLYPTFGDLDGDGHKDLIVGDADGKLHLFKNDGNGNFLTPIPNYSNIDIGYFAHPQLIDVNRDGLIDLIIGEQDGTINYFPNSGSNTVAVFDTAINNFGGVDVDTAYISTGYSTPKLIDSNGVYKLFVGSYTGYIYEYTNIDNNLTGQFTQVSHTTSNIWDGGRSAFTFADITNDNQLDMIVGNISGGLAYFSSDTSIINKTDNIKTENEDLIIYPNPIKNNITTIKSNKIGNLVIKDLFGKTVYSENKNSVLFTLNTSSLSKGFYVIQIEDLSKILIIK